ncbi:MAG TPA: DUF465 domain-containing protein [Polyangiaceae bacterium]|nr:DUF465 domain-containing protein [Polyangiaceae bacterium]
MKAAAGTAFDRMRELEEHHRNLDERLKVLTRRAYLTPDEQREASQIKRQKLVAKDRMVALSREER